MKWVDRCLKSLRESSVPLNLVIIDNGSKDNTISYIKENYQDAHIIVNDKNKGFGQANNQGIEYAYNNGATHFFLLNQDAWIQKDSVSVLVETMDRYHLAVVSPIQLNGDGTMYDKSFCRAAVFNTQNVSLISDLTFGTIKDYYTVILFNFFKYRGIHILELFFFRLLGFFEFFLVFVLLVFEGFVIFLLFF